MDTQMNTRRRMKNKVSGLHGSAADHYKFGLSNLDNYRLDQALLDFTAAIRMTDTNYKFYLMRGIVYSEMEKFDEAISDLTRSIELKPNYSDSYNNRGCVYYRIREYDHALQDFSESLRHKPNDEFVKWMCRKLTSLVGCQY